MKKVGKNAFKPFTFMGKSGIIATEKRNIPNEYNLRLGRFVPRRVFHVWEGCTKDGEKGKHRRQALEDAEQKRFAGFD